LIFILLFIQYSFKIFYFIFRNQLKSIKRKNALNAINNDTDNNEDLFEICQKELSSNRLSKQILEKIFSNFNKHLEICNERQKALEQRQDELEKKFQEYYIQNQKLICEVASRK
jgi:hypothetical protein